MRQRGGASGGTKVASLDESRRQYANGYYGKKLDQGQEFQDFVTQALYQRGIVIVGYSSRRYQIEHGENMLGAEIKRDDRFRDTGNLYIEVAEKSHPNNPSYVESGILRDDNSWLFLIGDELEIWVFAIKQLRGLIPNYRAVKTPTSRGVLMPVRDADRHSILKLDLRPVAPWGYADDAPF